jgi:gliding motility-associated-like protein
MIKKRFHSVCKTAFFKLQLKILKTLICLLLYNGSFADTFIVTSNADSGPGTLREAIQKAADNGTSVTDTILFNLPTFSRADRTIVLDATLPRLSSHLIIDGTSQNATSFGISDARVEIQNKLYLPYFTFFEALNVSDLQIYGLYLHGRNATYALNFTGINNMFFGKPGKGNIVNGFALAFASYLGNYVAMPSDSISIQSNLFGIDESGDFADNTTYNNIQFNFVNVFNLLLGGLEKDEGNLMCDNNRVLDWDSYSPGYSGYLRIEGNKIGTDRTGLKRLVGNSGGITLSAYNAAGTDRSGTSTIDVSIINNISAEGIYMSKFKNYFKIQGNRFGVGADNVTNITLAPFGLIIVECPKGIIGGDNPSDKNYIANFTGTNGIRLYYCGDVTVSKNSLFCNGYGISIEWYLPRPKPFITINKLTSTDVSGNSLPNATIELFYDDACPGCEGKTYIGTTTADANGNWIYNGNNSGGIVATATDTFGATSEFSSPKINTDSVQVKDASCGKANGAIKHLLVVSGTDWHWEDEAGNVITRDTDLVNVPPGKYKFVTSIGGNSCKTESVLYEIKNLNQPAMDTSFISMVQPSCGMNNGSLKNNAAFNNSFQYQWVNNAGDILLKDFSSKNPFTNLPPAGYYLKLRLPSDSTCFTKYGPFTLINQSGLTLNTNNIKITNTTCEANNGSIKNITYRNATGTVYTAWEDSTGKTVGNNIDLTGMSKGKYRLKFKDGGGCDTIVTPYFIIRDTGTITVDTSLMIVQPSSCKGSDGSITRITSTNATLFNWVNVASGSQVGNNEDVYGLTEGTYQLELTNSFGCAKSIKPVFVSRYDFLADTVLDVAITDANCFLDNGAIKINHFSRDSSLYSFKWINGTTDAVISTNTSIQNLPAGFYTLTATDTSGCSQVIFSADVPQIGKPGFDTHALKILGDTCHSGRGSIQNLLTRDSSRIDSLREYTWSWYNKEHQEISSLPGNLYSIPAGVYYVTIKDQFNCTVNSDLFTVTNEEFIPGKPQVNDQYIPRNTTTEIAVINPQKGVYELLNDDLPGSQPLAFSDNGTFQTPPISVDRSFFIRYNNGDCGSPLSKINIKVFDSTIIYVPNAFSPNNDGLNDKFHVTIRGKIESFHISVYNRFGNVVYSSSNPNGNWDGTLNGVPAPGGVFVYLITAISYENKNIKQKGIITLLR